MRVLVTGGAGFIASHIVDELIKLNHDVCIVDNLSSGMEKNINDDATFYNCDITDKDKLKSIFKIQGPEVVIHHAAQIDVQASLEKPVFDAKVNIVGTINILECCKEFGIRKIIYPSSAAVYGAPKYLPVDENHPVEPISFYGISKHTPEHYIKAYAQLYGLKYTIFRYANVFGTRQDPKGEGGVISIFADKLLNNETPFIFGDGEQTRDFIYVEDIVQANILALCKGDNELLNLSTNKAIKINGLFKVMKDISGSKVSLIYKEARKGDVMHSYLDNKRAEEKLGWKVKVGLKEGLTKTIEYCKKIRCEEKKIVTANNIMR